MQGGIHLYPFFVCWSFGRLSARLKGPISMLDFGPPVCKIFGLMLLVWIFGWSPATSISPRVYGVLI